MGFVLAVFIGTIETGDAYGTGQRVHFFVEHIEEVKRMANPPLGRGYHKIARPQLLNAALCGFALACIWPSIPRPT
jgi:ABC-type arginine transport system permease subunit